MKKRNVVYLKELEKLKKKNDDYNFSMSAYGELEDGHDYLSDKEFIAAVAELMLKAVAENLLVNNND